jgi:hypothetical protein
MPPFFIKKQRPEMLLRSYVRIFFLFFCYLTCSYGESLSFGDKGSTLINAENYDSGQQSSVARHGNVIIEVHASGYFYTLWYKVGIIKEGNIFWGESHQYDSGDRPSVAIYGNTIVEVHQSEGYETLWYHVGTLNIDSKTISWGDSQMYADGSHASVAMNGDILVETHQIFENDMDVNKIFYRTGKVNKNSKTIEWTYSDNNEPLQIFFKGVHSSIAISGNTIVETHESYNSMDLLYRVGVLNANTIEWKAEGSYDKGVHPSVSIAKDLIFEMHESSNTFGLWYRVGKFDLDTKTVKWGSSHYYDYGLKPSVVIDDHNAVEVHSSENFNSLYENIGSINEITGTIDWAK